MNISSIGAQAGSLSQAGNADAIQIAVLKKAMNVNAQGVLQLIQATSTVANASNPPNLGNSVDTYA